MVASSYSALFAISGLGKIGGYTDTAAYMSAVGVPAAFLPLVIVTELGGSLAIIFGWKTRIAAFLLAGYTLLAAIIFHHNFGNQIEMYMFLKNIAITGALLMVVVNGAGPFSFDQRIFQK